MKKKLKIAAVIIIISSAYLFGRVQRQILDDINMTSAIGYDYVDKDTVKATAVLPVYKPDQSVGNRTITASDELSKKTLSKINRQAARQVVNGKTEVALYSKKVAKQGIGGLVDSLQRDPSISERMMIVVVDGEANELLNKKYGDRDTGVYLSMLIEQNMKAGLVPKTNLHQFLNDYNSELKDPFLPLIEQKNEDIYFKGIALFKDDHYVKSLRQDQQFIFQALSENLRLGTYKLRLKNNEYAAIENINTKNSYRVQNVKGIPEINIHVKVKGIIREYTGRKTDEKEINLIRKQVEKDLEHQAAAMIRTFQRLKIDPLGFGEQVRSRTRNFNDRKWLEHYSDVKISVRAKVSIIEKGVVD
ncbi:Ger(x)C family spore germination protein [Neobacillus soli]|uniref:Ger(x)C family spore germination protein n=1 Tax=Neobacillus soli TaxID=220688 RepID=UPI000826830F|nr:Ger(x)C family spore germination protein [Neobacillus soli]